MANNDKINGFQFFVIVFVFMIGNTILYVPPLIVTEAKQDAWISSILALCFGICLIVLYNFIGGKFPTKTVVQYNELLLGKIVGKLVSFLLLVYIFIIATLMLQQLGTFVTTIILPETPRLVADSLFLLVVLLGTHLGIETISRSAETLFPIILLLLILFLISLSGQLEFINLKPIYENGMKPILRGALTFISTPYLQPIILLMIFPSVNNIAKAKKSFLLGVSIAGFFLITSLLYSILVIGVPLTEFTQYPTYFLAQKINIAEVFERVEVLVAFIWFVTIFFKTTILFFAANLGLVQILELNDKKQFVLPLGLLLLLVSQFIVPNVVYFDNFFREIMPFFTLTFGFLLPLILYIVYLMKRMQPNSENSGNETSA